MGLDPGQTGPEKGGVLVKLAAQSLVREPLAFSAEPVSKSEPASPVTR
jgi:creatinine amidohydrolase